MRAVQYNSYGSPDVLDLGEAPEPHPGPGEVRIAVEAAAVNPMDTKLRSGMFASKPLSEPKIPGLDAAGVVDELGEDVTDVAVGDRVFGAGSATMAQYAVLPHYWPVPEGVSMTVAAGLPTVSETSDRILSLLPSHAGATLVVDGAAGGVGTVLVQLARHRGLRVIGTASPAKHDLMRRLGAIPTTYGSGLADRVRELVGNAGAGGADVGSVDGAADLAGKGSAAELIELTGDASRVVTINDFSGATDAVISSGPTDQSRQTVAKVAELVASGQLELLIDSELDWTEAARAYELSESGHATGKIVLTIS